MNDAAKERAIQLLISEHTFVSGLIPFYRRVEVTALVGTGLGLATLLGFIGTLEAAPSDHRSLEADIVALASWLPTMLLLIELMALARILRASSYISTQLYPLAVKLSGEEDVFLWEFSPGAKLIEGAKGKPRLWRPFIRHFSSSTPLILAIGGTAVVLPFVALTLDQDHSMSAARLAGYLSALIAAALSAYAIAFTVRYESRSRQSVLGRNDEGAEAPEH